MKFLLIIFLFFSLKGHGQFIINPYAFAPTFQNLMLWSEELNNAVYNEELYELQDKLNGEYWRIIDTQLTKRQKEVLRLCADGYTQIEIAKMLKVNQSSITKSINGNCDYRNKQKRVYGGAKRKLRKIVSKDEAIQQILKRIAEIQDEGW